MSNMSNFNVGDAVKVYRNNIIGRIIHIDITRTGKEYGVIYFPKNANSYQDMLTIQAAEHHIRKIPVKNPPSCPSHSFVMDYIDEIAEKERTA